MENEKTLCWDCRHAVPKIVNSRYVRGCEWSIYKQPVPGWDAEKEMMRYNAVCKVSYLVKHCPKFERGRE